MATYRVTVRYGDRVHRYHTLEIEAEDVAEALRRTADDLPPDVSRLADLVELRPAVRPEERAFME